MKKKPIIFTDLDGTLLDDSYSFDDARPALSLIYSMDIPLVLCSSKTKPEIEHYRHKMNNHHPFISENGGGIFIPDGYFGKALKNTYHRLKEVDGYIMISIGTEYPSLRNALKTLRQQGFNVKGFGDMSSDEISQATGLGIEEAGMAKQRAFDEPFFFYGDMQEKEALFAEIKNMGLKTTEGRIHHLLGDNDKGKAVSILKALYREEYNDIFTVALGDGLNDVPMLGSTDICFIVERPPGGYDERINLPNLVKIHGVGPQGWNSIMQRLINDLFNY